MEHMGERKTFSTILQMKNRYKEVHSPWLEGRLLLQSCNEKSVKEVYSPIGERKTFSTTLQLRNL
jgi:hypothetical protein